LLEHRIVVDVDLDEWSKFSIDKCEIAICAVIGSVVRDRNQLIIRAAADIRAEPAIEASYKR
jgi:hypothetical protein